MQLNNYPENAVLCKSLESFLRWQYDWDRRHGDNQTIWCGGSIAERTFQCFCNKASSNNRASTVFDRSPPPYVPTHHSLPPVATDSTGFLYNWASLRLFLPPTVHWGLSTSEEQLKEDELGSCVTSLLLLFSYFFKDTTFRYCPSAEWLFMVCPSRVQLT